MESLLINLAFILGLEEQIRAFLDSLLVGLGDAVRRLGVRSGHPTHGGGPVKRSTN